MRPTPTSPSPVFPCPGCDGFGCFGPCSMAPAADCFGLFVHQDPSSIPQTEAEQPKPKPCCIPLCPSPATAIASDASSPPEEVVALPEQLLAGSSVTHSVCLFLASASHRSLTLFATSQRAVISALPALLHRTERATKVSNDSTTFKSITNGSKSDSQINFGG